MSDIRKKAAPRTESIVLKLSAEEQAALAQLAAANFRSAGDQLRYLLAEAVKAHATHVCA
jgi:hypothetical protein